MVGAIRKRDILVHPFVTVQCFGWRVFYRALMAGRDQTFLSLLADSGAMPVSTELMPHFVDRCVDLELKAKQIYEELARRFADRQGSAAFFDSLARQEQGHAELLQLCQAAAVRGQWKEDRFVAWRDAVPRLEQQMQSAERAADDAADLRDALRLVIRIESSEINTVFRGIVTATESDFVKRLQAFQTAGANHVNFIRREIPKLDPQLSEACRQMRIG
jgi:rubrerythrin